MPDISMCIGQDCPLKESCYRFTAIPDEFWQAYFLSIPYNAESGTCMYHWWNNREEENTAIPNKTKESW